VVRDFRDSQGRSLEFDEPRVYLGGAIQFSGGIREYSKCIECSRSPTAEREMYQALEKPGAKALGKA
jgi:hypothetical protein